MNSTEALVTSQWNKQTLLLNSVSSLVTPLESGNMRLCLTMLQVAMFSLSHTHMKQNLMMSLRALHKTGDPPHSVV